MTAFDQAHPEAGYVVDVNGWWLLAIVALALMCWVIASWRSQTQQRHHFRDIDRLARRDRQR